MYKYILMFMLTSSSVSLLYAQDNDWVALQYNGSNIAYHDTAAYVRQVDIKARLPIYMKNSNTWIGALGYKNVSLSHFPENYATGVLHGMLLQTAWIHRFTKYKSIALFIQAGIFSDMKDINSKDIRFSSGFRYRIKHSEKLSSGWGLAYARQFFGNQLIPFIDVNYNPNGKWSISGQFPIKPKILYHVNKKLSAGIEISGEASSYRLSATSQNNRFVQMNQWTGLGKIEYCITPAWQLHIGLGSNFKQSYKLYEDASAAKWTIITIPVGQKQEPIRRIDSRSLNVQCGISYNISK